LVGICFITKQILLEQAACVWDVSVAVAADFANPLARIAAGFGATGGHAA
jgi:hypothetical protein